MAIGAKRILVAGSALARPTWKAQFELWRPELDVHTIRFGPLRVKLTQAELAERIAAYEANIQIVSYNLLRHMDAKDRDVIILDEVHALRSPLSQQSKYVKSYLRANPKIPVIALTATPIPNEVANIWNLVDSLWPGYLGRATRTGDIPWSFKTKFMNSEPCNYTPSKLRFFGAKDEALPELAARLAPLMHRVTEDQFAKFLPPIVPNILYIDDDATDLEVARGWLEERIGNNRTHLGLFPFSHALCAAIVEAALKYLGYEVFSFTGADSTEKRLHLIRRARQAERSILVASAESVRESVSLSGVKDALILEWRGTPLQALQLFGRFARADGDPRPTYISYVAHAADENRAAVLQERLDVTSKLYAADTKTARLQELFAPRIRTEQEIESMLLSMFEDFREGAVERQELGEDDE